MEYRGLQKNDVMQFGVHGTIDGYGASPSLLDNSESVRAALEDLAELLGMHKISEPTVVEAGPNNKKDPGGWSGFLLIAESHISLHTFPNRQFISVDVYTCQNSLDMQRIVEFLKDAFELDDVETHVIKRGTRYPVKNVVRTKV